MENKKSEIEKLVIHLTDYDNVTNAFQLERQDNENSITWRFCDKHFEIEIITDKEIRKISQIKKSDTIAESIEEIRHKFSDSAFESKMNWLINVEDGFDDADENEENDCVKYNPYNSK